MTPAPPFTAETVVTELRAAMRQCISLQEQSWLIRDVFPSAGHLLGELRVRVRAAVTDLLTPDIRKSDLVRELGVPRITIDTWTMKSAKGPSTKPVGMPAATPENLAGASKILDVAQVLAEVDQQAARLDGFDKARFLISVQGAATSLVAMLREIRKMNGVARLSEGVRRQAVIDDLGITVVTVHEWAKIAAGQPTS